MTELTASSVETFVTTQVSTFAAAAAGIITTTVILGLAIFLVFKGLRWLKGGM
jgi:hypothetical protein